MRLLISGKLNSFLKKIEFFIDYYFLHLLYKPSKFYRYHKYMKTKWGTKIK